MANVEQQMLIMVAFISGGGKSSVTNRQNLVTVCIEAKTENRQSQRKNFCSGKI